MTDTNTNTDARTEHEQIATDGDLNPHRLIFGRELTEDDSVCRFTRSDDALGNPLSTEDVDLLIRTGHLDPADRQNNGPPAHILQTRAGVLEQLNNSHGDTDHTTVRLIGYVVPEHRDDARITVDGMIATPTEEDGVIPDVVKHQFEILGDESVAREEEEEVQVGSMFGVADELTLGDELCRVWWG